MHISKSTKIALAAASALAALLVACGSGSSIDPDALDQNSEEAKNYMIADANVQDTAALAALIEKCKNDTNCIKSGIEDLQSSSSAAASSSSAAQATSSSSAGAASSSATEASSSSAGGTSSAASSSSKASSSSVAKPLSATCKADADTVDYGAKVTWTATASNGAKSYTYLWDDQSTAATYSVASFTSTSAVTPKVTVKDAAADSVAPACPSAVLRPLKVTCTPGSESTDPNTSVTWTAKVTGGNGTDTLYNWNNSGNSSNKTLSVAVGTTNTAPTLKITRGTAVDTSITCTEVKVKKLFTTGQTVDVMQENFSIPSGACVKVDVTAALAANSNLSWVSKVAFQCLYQNDANLVSQVLTFNGSDAVKTASYYNSVSLSLGAKTSGTNTVCAYSYTPPAGYTLPVDSEGNPVAETYAGLQSAGTLTLRSVNMTCSIQPTN